MPAQPTRGGDGHRKARERAVWFPCNAARVGEFRAGGSAGESGRACGWSTTGEAGHGTQIWHLWEYHLSIRNLPPSTDLLSLRATLRAQGTRILRLTREQVPVGNARVEAPSQAFCSMLSPGVLVGQALQPHTDHLSVCFPTKTLMHLYYNGRDVRIEHKIHLHF